MNEFWSSIDAVLVINLDHRYDRWHHLQKQLKGLVPPEKIYRISAVYGKELEGYGKPPWFERTKRPENWAGRAGCVLSHQKALRLAQERDYKNVLILEDDAQLEEVNTQLWESLGTTLTSPYLTWDICYLGFNKPSFPFRFKSEINDTHELHQIYGAKCTHAYLIRPQARDWILSQLPNQAPEIWSWVSRHRAIDLWYSFHLSPQFTVFGIQPVLFSQRQDTSDITSRVSDQKFKVSMPRYFDDVDKFTKKMKRAEQSIKWKTRKLSMLALIKKYWGL